MPRWRGLSDTERIPGDTFYQKEAVDNIKPPGTISKPETIMQQR